MIHETPDYIVESPFDLIEAEGIEEVHRLMAPCRNCGELRPRSDLSMSISGICPLCRANTDVRKRDTTKILAMWEDMDDAAIAGTCAIDVRAANLRPPQCMARGCAAGLQ